MTWRDKSVDVCCCDCGGMKRGVADGVAAFWLWVKGRGKWLG